MESRGESEQTQFWQFSDQLRLQSSSFVNISLNDNIWSSSFASKRHEERRNFDVRVGAERRSSISDDVNGASIQKNFNVDVNGLLFNKGVYSKPNNNNYERQIKQGKSSNKSNDTNNKNINSSSKSSGDKRFKTLPPSESLPRSEAIGGYIFVCNNDTMQENLKRQLFGLPPRYRDSVRAIRPGLPLFLYNYSTHQLHGIFEALSFGGTNIDPNAWEDKKCPGESRFPAQVRVVMRKLCKPLEEDSFRPVLHHYDGPKFRLELNIPEALSLLDIFADYHTQKEQLIKGT
ncbi:hypothetical protein Sjap_021162 [Stephania japonica]|uniref:DCD domain-containing protein n=1 Tax=Stephania japonica TaxID=461633 RepID=A0AAP0F796_9MAGN